VLPLKDLRGRSVGKKVTGWGLKILRDLEGLLGGRAWFAGHFPFRQGRDLRSPGCGGRKDRADYRDDYSILVQLVKDYFKWFGC